MHADRFVTSPSARRQVQRGFTLMELMIVVAIIGILAAVAYPSYQEHIVKTNRGNAKACLSEYAQFMERFYTTNMRYDQTAAGVAIALPNLSCSDDLSSRYVIGFAAGSPQTGAYELEAVPLGVQASSDTLCKTLTLDSTGTRGVTDGATGTAALCW